MPAEYTEMKVVIDGIEYVPKGEVPPIDDVRLQKALRELTSIQYFSSETHKHRAWAWDALNALAPELAKLPANLAFERVREGEE